MPLSDVACRQAKPREKSYKMGDSGGLYLEITPKGSKLWRMKYRYGGKEKRLALGQYPEVSLADARDGRDKARKLLAEHNDPSLAKQEKKRLAQASAANTFEALALEWHEKNKGNWSPNHASTVLRRLEQDLFPAIGNLPIKEITTPRLAIVIENIEKRGAYDIARRALQYSRAIFAYAQLRGKIDTNPADIKAKDFLAPIKQGHYAAMEAKDLPEFLSKLYSNEARLFISTQLALEMMLLTFVRTSELIKARWDEFDFEKRQWIIPAERMKMNRDHIVPLSKQVLRILEQLKPISEHREFLFPGQRNPKTHMSNGAILMALKRMGYHGIHTGHGFRALAMTTIMEELGYPHEVPDTQLAHAKGDSVRRAYDRTKFLAQRKKMMQEWADYIENISHKNGKLIQGRFSRKVL
ncbi:tyrosine-type recombinase/integrase [Micavibrio aeruginosavorus]|uniref:Phage integrase n=1 Tax=Micavibrio aeruginosavorus EPB TaxID=349215 RepID=M4VH58_9BACT|nr:integrase arm-type DNA-binding domain-containing protein [Micavibrio aeruginosavorus]AGH97825.1 phage integrase [Micavibrio aeruginosavorus EPB]